MLKEKRFRIIMDMLNAKHFVSIQEIILQTGLTKSTIRRDLMELERKDKLVRTRGGAALYTLDLDDLGAPDSEPPFAMRQSKNLEEKRRIAQAALQYIHPDTSVFIESGTTLHELGLLLKNYHQNLKVATNDLLIASEIAGNNNITFVMIGGEVRRGTFSTIGYMAEAIVRDIHVDAAFIGADAIDLNLGVVNFSMDEVSVKRAMIRSAREVIIVCDHEKFSTVAFVKVCDLEDIDCIITGRELDPKIVEKLEKMGIDVILA